MADRPSSEHAPPPKEAVWPLRVGAAASATAAIVGFTLAAPDRFEVTFAAALLWLPVCLSFVVSLAVVPRISRADRIGWPTKITLAGTITPVIAALPLTFFPWVFRNAVEFYSLPSLVLLSSFGVLLLGGARRYRWALTGFAVGMGALIMCVALAHRFAQVTHNYSRLAALADPLFFPAKLPLVAALTAVFALGTTTRRVGVSPRWLRAEYVRGSLGLALLLLVSPSGRVLAGLPGYRLVRFLLDIVLFRERNAPFAEQAAFLVAPYWVALFVVTALVLVGSRCGRAQRHPLVGTVCWMSVSAALFGLASIGSHVMHGIGLELKASPASSFLLAGSLLAGAAFGGICVGRPARIVLTNAVLASLVALVFARMWAFRVGWPLVTEDDAQLVWKVPAVGSILVLASFFAAWARAEGRPARGTRRAALGLALVAGTIWVQPFALPRTVTLAGLRNVRGLTVTEQGDVVFQAEVRGHPKGVSSLEAVFLRRAGEAGVRCLSVRPLPQHFANRGRVSLSPDGGRVAFPETATPLQGRLGLASSMFVEDLRSGARTRLFWVDRESREDERGFGIILGPGEAWVAPGWRAVRGGSLGGREFRISLPDGDSSGPLWFGDNQVFVFSSWCGASGGAGVRRSCLTAVDLRNGKNASRFLPVAGNCTLVSHSPLGLDMVVRTLPATREESPHYYWIDSGWQQHPLMRPDLPQPQRPGWPTNRATVVVWRRSGAPVLVAAAERHEDVRELGGRILAVRGSGPRGAGPGMELQVVDESLTTQRTISTGLEDLQWLRDSIVYRQTYGTMLGPGVRWVRYWPATDRQEVVFEKMVFEMP